MEINTPININHALFNDLMIKIPKGIIEMRDDRINEKWKVEINPFLLSKFPVTQNLYETIMKENPSMFKGEYLPVETVSWKDAITFCNKLSEHLELIPCYLHNSETSKVTYNPIADGFRLPTEAEWQHACMAGLSEIRYGLLDDIAWYKKNSSDHTHDVGEKEPNNWGLYDMLGNVWEWCSDIYDETIYGSYRVFRGGGWCDEERSVMATTRRRSHPISFKIEDLGFRIARNKI